MCHWDRSVFVSTGGDGLQQFSILTCEMRVTEAPTFVAYSRVKMFAFFLSLFWNVFFVFTSKQSLADGFSKLQSFKHGPRLLLLSSCAACDVIQKWDVGTQNLLCYWSPNQDNKRPLVVYSYTHCFFWGELKGKICFMFSLIFFFFSSFEDCKLPFIIFVLC